MSGLIPELLTLSQASKRYGVSVSALFTWHRKGILECRLAGRALVTTPEAMELAMSKAPKIGRPPGAKDKAPRRRTAKPRDNEEAQPG